jgi:hypothetical protein
MEQTTFLYLSFNSDVYHRQTLFSVLSLIYFIRNKRKELYNIVLYSDNIAFYKKYFYRYPVVLKEFNNSIKKNWLKEGSKNTEMNEIDIKTTIKIMSIISTLEEYRGKVIFVDDDTFFLKDPFLLATQIKENQSIMYFNEGRLSESTNKNWNELKQTINNNVFNVFGEAIKIPLYTEMWNAGVIGISYENLKLIKKVLMLASQLHKIGENPNFYHDQIMFSYILQSETNLRAANETIFHYCYGYRKENFNRSLKHFFLKEVWRLNPENILDRVHEICLQEISNKPIKNVYKELKNFFYKRKIGLYLAIERVKKAKRISSFFERGVKY